jgi:hypothetical protein
MPPESVSRPETTTLIVKLARFAILCTLALMGVLLIFHLLTNGRLGLLTESVVQSSLYVIGIVTGANFRAPLLGLMTGRDG